MIKVGEVLVSDDIRDVEFVCHLEKCKGACCVEGDLGAPLEEDELPIMKEIQEKVKPYLTPEGLKSIEEQGAYILDEDGDYSTPTIGGKECAYAHYNDLGILKCGIEQAYLDGKIEYRKPISCHLYLLGRMFLWKIFAVASLQIPKRPAHPEIWRRLV